MDKLLNMNLDQQISFYEARIMELEESKHNSVDDPMNLGRELENAYQQVALLKIRRMMDISV